jgi:signal peptidase II
VIIGLDQLSKYIVIHTLNVTSVVHVLPFLNIIQRFNTGAAFSFLSTQAGWQIYLLSGISVLVSLVLIVWLSRMPRHEWWNALPIALVLGGAIGNLIDRVRFGFVIDFIDFHVGNWHYATFNIADSAVCVGAMWLVLRLFYESIARKS